MTSLQLEVLEQRFRLRPDVELIDGADGAPMLFDALSGRYVRLGRQAAQIVRNLDGTVSGADIADRISERSGVARATVDPQLARLFSELSASGIFEGHEAQSTSAKDRVAKAVGRTPTWTRPLLKDGLTRLVEPVSKALRATPSLVRLLAATALMGLSLPFSINAVRGYALPITALPWLLGMALMFTQTVFHELGHAVSCRVHGVKPRELGLALWYGVVPIAYVDRTDAYRVRSRGARAAISIIGPVQDVIWSGVWALLAMNTTGLAHDATLAATVLALTMAAVNLNPLLPTDGQQALEAALGELNMRGRAMAYLAHVVLRAELPTYLMHLTRRRKTVYVVYGTACIVYVVFVMGGMAWWLGTLALRITGVL